MNTLYYGDNLKILQKYVQDQSVALIYLDPPFNSKRAYNVIFKDKAGKDASAQIHAFEDTWQWTRETQESHDQIMTGDYPVALKEVVKSFKGFLGINNLMAYLTMMAIRLMEMHRVLKDTGSLYLHCDPTASHYLKILLDQIFGVENFRNEIIWRRTGSHNYNNRYGPIHDIILFYTKSQKFAFNILRTPYAKKHVEQYFKETSNGRLRTDYYGNVLTGSGIRSGESGMAWKGFDPTKKKRHWAIPGKLVEELKSLGIIDDSFDQLGTLSKLDKLYQLGSISIQEGKAWPIYSIFLSEKDGIPIQDIWAYQPYSQGILWDTEQGIDEGVRWMAPGDSERLGYDTQKPVALLERIIQASSNEGDVVMDPFCGCGTAVVAAEKLGRNWIGIDITHLAISLIKKRLHDHFPDVDFKVEGEPESVAGAQELADQSKFQFEAWAVSLLGGQPYKSKGGGDTGIDGLLYFKDYEGKFHRIIIEVKGGGYQPKDIRSLGKVLDREDAPMGVVIALQPPTPGMVKEAAVMGSWTMPVSGRVYPKMQIFTIQDYYDGKRPELPETGETLKKAKRELRDKEKTPKLKM